MNKKILLMLWLITTLSFVKSQIAIGKETVTNSATILDFVDGSNLGIVLPKVDTLSRTYSDGTLIYNITSKKVELKTTSGWKDLSINESTTFTIPSDYSSLNEVGGGVIIGSDTSKAVGALVLESSSTALILPRMNRPYENIVNPKAGTMAYDTESQMICIFNGDEWSFWGE